MYIKNELENIAYNVSPPLVMTTIILLFLRSPIILRAILHAICDFCCWVG